MLTGWAILAIGLAKVMFSSQSISVHGGQAMAETPILSWSATYFLLHLGLRGVGQWAIASNSQLCDAFLDPPRIDGVTIQTWSGFYEPALTASSEAELMETPGRIRRAQSSTLTASSEAELMETPYKLHDIGCEFRISPLLRKRN